MRREKYQGKRNLCQKMWKYLVEVGGSELRDDKLHPYVGKLLYPYGMIRVH